MIARTRVIALVLSTTEMRMTKPPKKRDYEVRMEQHAQYTAQHAKPRRAGPTKAEKRLERRMRDFETLTKRDGFRRPGSLQR
jgi:hypothetical protein